jgi:hypothetical protein
MLPCDRHSMATRSWLGLVVFACGLIFVAAVVDGSSRATTPEPPSVPQTPAAAVAAGRNVPRPIISERSNAAGQIGRALTSEDWRRAEAELEARGIRRDTKEFRYRLQVLRNVATVKEFIEFPDAPEKEKRNPEFWVERDDSYVVRDDRRPVDAILDLWKFKTSGIKCRKTAQLILVKTRIDFADDEERMRLDGLLRGKTIPEDLPGQGEGIYYTTPKPRGGPNQEFATDELLPGDQVWFKNSYYDRINPDKLTEQQKIEYSGDEGSNDFYMCNDTFLSFYERLVYTKLQFQRCIATYFYTVIDVATPAASPAPVPGPQVAGTEPQFSMPISTLPAEQLRRAFPLLRVWRPCCGPIPPA